jgi:hypothetical protein
VQDILRHEHGLCYSIALHAVRIVNLSLELALGELERNLTQALHKQRGRRHHH